MARPDDVCALCDTRIDPGAGPGWNAPHRFTSYWNPGVIFGTRRAVMVHHGCATLGDGQYDDQRDRPFEDTPLWENLAAWARRTFAFTDERQRMEQR